MYIGGLIELFLSQMIRITPKLGSTVPLLKSIKSLRIVSGGFNLSGGCNWRGSLIEVGVNWSEGFN